MTTERNIHRHAFATFVAVFLIGLFGIAMVSMTSLFMTENRRTRNSLIDAQLRQLLFAGGAQAQQNLEHAGENVNADIVNVALPAVLARERASLTYAIGLVEENRRLLVHVKATIGNRQAKQALRYQHDGNDWKLIDARLEHTTTVKTSSEK